MNDSKELVAVEQPQQLMTIEPAKYVELVFEPFAKRLENAKTLADAAEFDVTTTAGMAVAVKHRATFREIRVASEKARKERKAPILEIGKLLDSRQKEIEAEIEPFESRFDDAIKAEEARKEAEKAAKAAAEKARVDAIRKRIDEIRAIPASMVGKPSEHIACCIEGLEAASIELSDFAEFSGEAEMAKNAALDKLREMRTAQQAHEAEQTRLAAEREALERQRAELAEQERLAALARAEQEAKDRAERERLQEEQRAIQVRAATLLREQQEAHEAELRKQREADEAELRKQREEIARQQAEINAVKAEQERAERARLAAIESEARAKREAEEAAARAEAERKVAEERAKEAERLRRLRVEFESDGPGDLAIVEAIANRFEVSEEVAARWLTKFDAAPFLTPYTEQAA